MVSIERYTVPEKEELLEKSTQSSVTSSKSKKKKSKSKKMAFGKGRSTDAGSISSGQTKKTTATTLTVRQSNVMSSLLAPTKSASTSNTNKSVADPPTNNKKPPLPTTKAVVQKKSTPPPAPAAPAPTASTKTTTHDPTSFYAPDAPLPTARQLAKVLCRIVDDEAYTRNDASLALQRLHQWALKQDVKFGNNLVSIGVIQLVLFFVEDHLQDAKAIGSALLLLEALTTPLDDYESKAVTNMRAKVSQNIVEGGGIELLLKAFAYHGLPEQTETALGEKSLLDAELEKEKDSLWNTLSSVFACDGNENDPLGIACNAIMGPADPRLARNHMDASKRAIDTAILCMKVLSQVVPHASGAIPDKSAVILTTVIDTIPKLKVDGTNKTPAFVKQEQEALVSSVMSCLVAAVKLADEKVLKQNKATAKEVVDVTVQIMRDYPSHPQIVCDGCLVLQGVCPYLSKMERKRYGVVAALGAVVASDSMTDRKVKEIADGILEEMFQ